MDARPVISGRISLIFTSYFRKYFRKKEIIKPVEAVDTLRSLN